MPKAKHYPPKRVAQRDVKRWLDFYAPSPMKGEAPAEDKDAENETREKD